MSWLKSTLPQFLKKKHHRPHLLRASPPYVWIANGPKTHTRWENPNGLTGTEIEALSTIGPKAKKYLPDAFLGDLGNHPTVTAFYTDDRPPKRDGSLERAVLIDKVGAGHCFVRNIRIEGGQVFVTSPLWPHAEVPFPLNYFQSIERVLLISFCE